MPTSPFEVVGVIAGILGVWLTTRQKIWCWPVGIVSVASFIVVFAGARLYGAMVLQCVYMGLLAYGWHAWLHGGEGRGALRVSRLPRRSGLGLLVLAAAAAGAGGCWFHARTDHVMPYVDSFTTSFSLAAQWMQARKYLENWVLWVVVDVAYVGMSLSQGLTLTAGLYAVFIGLALLGIRDWRRSMMSGGRA